MTDERTSDDEQRPRAAPSPPGERPVDIELGVVAHHQPDQQARDAAAADDAARRAGYSDEALETLRLATSAEDEITEAQREVRDKTAKGMMLVGVRTVVVRGLGLLGTIFLARLLSPADYGVVALGLTIIVLGRFLADGGLGPGLIRREQPPDRYEYAALLSFQQLVTWPVALVGSILAFTVLPLGDGDGAITLSLMLLGMVIDVMRSANSIACERDLNYQPIVRAEIVEFLVYNILAIGLVSSGMGLLGVGVANVARAATGSGLLILTGPVGWIAPRWNGAVVKSLAKFGAYFQASWLATMLRDQGLAMLVFAISGRASLGAFDQARRLLVIVTLVFESAWRVGLPGIARMMEAGAAPKMLLERGLGLAGVAMAFPVVGLVASCEWLVPLLLGPGWNETARLLPWVGAALMITMPIATVISTLLWAQDQPKKVFAIGLPALAVTLAAGALAMTRYDAVGAGIGLFCGGITFVLSAVGMAREAFGPGTIPRFAGPILAAGGASVAGWAAASAVDPGNLLGTLLAGAVSIAALLVLLLLFARRSAMDLWRFIGKATG